MKKLRKQPPSQLLRDSDGHWYIVPETEVARFEAALELLAQDEWSPEWDRTWSKIKKTPIDGPHRLRLLVWEEMT